MKMDPLSSTNILGFIKKKRAFKYQFDPNGWTYGAITTYIPTFKNVK